MTKYTRALLAATRGAVSGFCAGLREARELERGSCNESLYLLQKRKTIK